MTYFPAPVLVLLLDPGSRMDKKSGSGIRNKYPGSITLNASNADRGGTTIKPMTQKSSKILPHLVLPFRNAYSASGIIEPKKLRICPDSELKHYGIPCYLDRSSLLLWRHTCPPCCPRARCTGRAGSRQLWWRCPSCRGRSWRRPGPPCGARSGHSGPAPGCTGCAGGSRSRRCSRSPSSPHHIHTAKQHVLTTERIEY
jgi:hypothetical protein